MKNQSAMISQDYRAFFMLVPFMLVQPDTWGKHIYPKAQVLQNLGFEDG